MTDRRSLGLSALREVAAAIREAESRGAPREERAALFQARAELIAAALEDERRPADIARALGISRQRVAEISRLRDRARAEANALGVEG